MTDGTQSGMTDPMPPKLVGPVIRGMDADLAASIAAAIEADNPGREVHVIDRGGYIRIHTAQRCRLTRSRLEAELGHDFPLSRIEPALGGFAGRMHLTNEEITWYLERQD